MNIQHILFLSRIFEQRLSQKIFRGQIRLEYLGIVIGLALVLFVVIGVLALRLIDKANSPSW